MERENYTRYSLSDNTAESYAHITKSSLAGQELSITLPSGNLTAHVQYLGVQGARVRSLLLTVASMLGFDRVAIRKGSPSWSRLLGACRSSTASKNTKIIDDTYNASPVAVKAALDVLYDSARANSALLSWEHE
ncbi:hypothetical protein IPL68_00435 [Candidatus Saccharibacteria bacterium]|nr:MAG: hypothetical protein IPL68_00435 [Candidatus Saccharibacteria bacterium]